jgi:hypothetical protein
VWLALLPCLPVGRLAVAAARARIAGRGLRGRLRAHPGDAVALVGVESRHDRVAGVPHTRIFGALRPPPAGVGRVVLVPFVLRRWAAGSLDKILPAGPPGVFVPGVLVFRHGLERVPEPPDPEQEEEAGAGAALQRLDRRATVRR